MLTFPAAIMLMDDDDDRVFMEKLYVEHRYLLFKVAYDIVKDAQTAEDMVSEACISLIANIDTLRKLNICKVKAYIVTTVRNASLDCVRKRSSQSRKSFLTDEEHNLNVPGQEQVDDDLIRRAEITAIRFALKKMRDPDRELLQMKYFDLMSDAEIAQKLHIQSDSVRYYLTKARRNLRRILEEERLI